MVDINFSLQTTCPVCDTRGQQIIALAKYPITELYVEWTPEFVKDGFLDQALHFCGNCRHAYLEKILDVRFIYQNYVTASAASQGAMNCLKSFKEFIDRHIQVSDYRLLLDIGGNDSTFLSYFKGLDLRLVNVDPNASGGERYETVRCFLEDVDLADYKRIDKKIVVSSHTIEHLAQPAALIRSISESLNSDDYCFLQFPSIESLVENLRFDQICHQHINYFSLTSIAKLLNNYGLHIIDYEYDDAHFGTLRVAASLKSNAVADFQRPAINAFSIAGKYDLFRQYYSQLNEALSTIFDNGTGFGAGLMVPTLAYHLPIINSLKYIVDENTSKHGKRFINLQPKIVPLAELNIGDPILITSISTKSAARAIFNKLAALDVKHIVLPTILT